MAKPRLSEAEYKRRYDATVAGLTDGLELIAIAAQLGVTLGAYTSWLKRVRVAARKNPAQYRDLLEADRDASAPEDNSWQREARCAGMGREWDDLSIEQQITMCRKCPVKRECRALGRSLKPHDLVFGGHHFGRPRGSEPLVLAGP